MGIPVTLGGIAAGLTGLLGQNPVAVTYSFKDLTGVLTNPVLGSPLPLAGGNIGNGTITIRMVTMRTEHDVAADGVVMPSYVAGRNAEVTIEMLQTADLHHAFVDLFNVLETAANSGDVSNWAGTTITFRTIQDGSTHVLSGVSFQKIPDKPYAARGQNITWTLMAADAVTM
jgi:hypothetical protein